MAKLSSAFVEHRVATEYDVQQALARQVLYGGDLATNLIEVSNVAEANLTSVNAGALGLPAAPTGALPPPAEDTLTLIPGDVALRFNVFPLGKADGKLEIAVPAKLEASTARQLSSALGLELEERVALAVRIRQAISREYGLPMDRRSDRAVAKLEGAPDPMPSAPPPAISNPSDFSMMPRPPTIPPIGLPSAAPGVAKEGAPTHLITEPPVQSVSAPPRSNTFQGFPAVQSPLAAPATAAAKPAPTQPFPAAPKEPPPDHTPIHDGHSAPPMSEAEDRISQAPSERAAAQRPQRERTRPLKRHRGPYTAALAEHDLRHAESTSEVLSAFFDFACQYFEYSAIFAVHGDIAEGRDAHGPGLDRGSITAIGVPLDLPSALSKARDNGQFILTRLDTEGLDRTLSTDLKRSPKKKVLVLPVAVRQRCVLLFYGDDGSENVALREVGEVLALAPLVSASVERILLERKRASAGLEQTSRRLPSVVPKPRYAPPPPLEQRAETLAQAIDPSLAPKAPSKGPIAADSAHTAPTAPGAPDSAKEPEGRAHSKTTAQPAPASRSKDAVREQIAAIPEPKPETVPAPPMPGEHSAVDPIPPAPPMAASPSAERAAAPHKPVGDLIEDDWDIPEDPLPQQMRGPSLRPPAGPRPTPHNGQQQIKTEPAPQNPEGDAPQNVEALLRAVLQGNWGAAANLAELGVQALALAIHEFPGPITHEHRGAEQASLAGPLLSVIAKQGEQAAPFVVVRTGDGDASVRRWATLLLSEMATPAGVAAATRRLLDENSQVRRAALTALKRMARLRAVRPAILDSLCGAVTNQSLSEDDRLVMLEGIVELRFGEAVRYLLPLLEESPSLADSAAWALSSLTRQDFAKDRATWEQWWRNNASRHRIQWLIDALTHPQEDVRRAARDELESISERQIQVTQDAGEKLGGDSFWQELQGQYEKWWETTGRSEHG